MNPVESLHGSVIHRRRVRRLAEWFARLLPNNASVLDLGAGDGRLSAAIFELRPDLRIQGVEVQPRVDCAIPVDAFDGVHLPYGDRTFGAVMLSDVLHHAGQPLELLREADRVATRCLVIKDHLLAGFLAGPTLRFMDRVGNRRFGVPVPGVYWPASQWRSAFDDLGLRIIQWQERLGLYPWWLNWWFGRSLHFVARLARR